MKPEHRVRTTNVHHPSSPSPYPFELIRMRHLQECFHAPVVLKLCFSYFSLASTIAAPTFFSLFGGKLSTASKVLLKANTMAGIYRTASMILALLSVIVRFGCVPQNLILFHVKHKFPTWNTTHMLHARLPL